MADAIDGAVAAATGKGDAGRDLMLSQDQDLHVFGDVPAREQRQPAEQPDHEQVKKAEEHERRV